LGTVTIRFFLLNLSIDLFDVFAVNAIPGGPKSILKSNKKK